ncbi:hypothetical protein SPRG_01392 [Saprolegnia parasitica CBS 223.65]|uniref:FYVE-type domain-containing protein n=1 Tax=Saprolegnia parasitica (strain CBS 223.65) TaxID=695850 RepID=A0A067D550_SAPPC|nr:hypothetical protein SPRG_01392 [Saprolegnia parasitica CBS 223.65]KDO34122.1 hypothetical protein SPRG_01392 [Saprolegnia parasitica CBS 223.65]|eukprot:XP_012194999.1 hypothetical protein SPRG_01392 [Saprolegnia parasitica CBS 223.65]
MEMPVTGQSILVFVCMRCSLRRRQSAPSPESAYNTAALVSTASSKALLPRASIDTIHETTDYDSNRDGSLFAFQLAIATPGNEQPAADRPTWALQPGELAPFLVPILGRFRCDHCRHVLMFRHRVNCRACGDVVCRRCVLPTIVQEHGQNDRSEIAVCVTCDEIHKALGSYKECRSLKRALGPSAYPPGVHVGTIDVGDTSRIAFARKAAHFKALEEAKLVPEDVMSRRDAAWSPLPKQATCPRCDRLVSWRSAGCCCMCGRTFCNTCVWRRFARSPGRYELDQVLVCSNCLLNFERETASVAQPTTESGDMDEARLEALLVQTIQRNLKLSHSIRWAPINAAVRCGVCARAFAAFRTKVHCHACGTVVCNGCAVQMPVQQQRRDAMVCTRCTRERPVTATFDGILFDPADLAPSVKTPAKDAAKPPEPDLSAFQLHVLPTIETTLDMDDDDEELAVFGSSRGVIPAAELVPPDQFVPSLSRMRCHRCRRLLLLHVRHHCSACAEVYCRSCVNAFVTELHYRLSSIDICRTCSLIQAMFGSFKECRWVHKSLPSTAFPPGVQVKVRCPLYVNRTEFARQIAQLKFLEEVDLVPWNHLPQRGLWSIEPPSCDECGLQLRRNTRARCGMCDLVYCLGCTTLKFTRPPHKLELEDIHVCRTCIATFERWNQTRSKQLWKTCATVYAKASGTHVDPDSAPPPTSPAGWLRSRPSADAVQKTSRSSGSNKETRLSLDTTRRLSGDDDGGDRWLSCGGRDSIDSARRLSCDARSSIGGRESMLDCGRPSDDGRPRRSSCDARNAARAPEAGRPRMSSAPVRPRFSTPEIPLPRPPATTMSADDEALLRSIERNLRLSEAIARTIESAEAGVEPAPHEQGRPRRHSTAG